MNAVIEPTPANLLAVAPTGFPVSYEAAKLAIQKCESPLECRTKADKAAAMAVYARMRDDTALLNHAVRLQAWADRRWGELDRDLYPNRRQENLKQNDRKAVDQNSRISADLPKGTRSPFGARPASPDGTSDYQRKISRRLAAIPEAEFTRQVESDNPPTVRQLASQGTVKRTVVLDPEYRVDKGPWSAIESAEAREGCATLEAFASFCADHEPELISRAVSAAEVEALRPLIAIAGEWIARLTAGFTDEQ